MKKIPALIAAMVLASQIHALASPQEWREKWEIWFTKPASTEKLGLPVGNGRLGAMLAGTFPEERIQLNNDIIWALEPMLRHPATTKDKIAKGKTEGRGQCSQIAPVTAQKFRLTLECEKGSPGMAELQFFPTLGESQCDDFQ
jgi:hypothetical protein